MNKDITIDDTSGSSLIPEFNRNEKFPWGDTTTIGIDTGNYDFTPDYDTGAALKEATKQAQQHALHFQQHITDMGTHERLNHIEDSLRTILNMLKLIMGAQLERDVRDKEKEKS